MELNRKSLMGVAMAASVPAFILLLLAVAEMTVLSTPWVGFIVTIVAFLYAGWRAVAKYGMGLLGSGLSGAAAAMIFYCLLLVSMQLFFLADFYVFGNAFMGRPGFIPTRPAILTPDFGFIVALAKSMVSGFIFAGIFGYATLVQKGKEKGAGGTKQENRNWKQKPGAGSRKH